MVMVRVRFRDRVSISVTDICILHKHSWSSLEPTSQLNIMQCKNSSGLWL